MAQDPAAIAGVDANQMEKELSTLTGLLKSGLLSGDVSRAIRTLVETAARTLRVERVSVWRFNADSTAIFCIDLYELSADRHSSGVTLPAEPYPGYFHALNCMDVIAADDAHHDPRTREFSKGYLTPLGITSMMDAPLQLKGVLEGVLCHEHVGPMRRWSMHEQTFAVAVANLVSLALEQHERTVLQQQLMQSEKIRAMGQLVSGVAHELNNPIMAIIGLAELAGASSNLAQNRKDLRDICSEARRCSDIVKSLSAFARKQEPRRDPCRVNDILTGLFKLLGNQLRFENIELTQELDAQIQPTLADSHRLQQVFLNITNNAVHALTGKDWHGPRRLMVQTRRAGDRIKIIFRDSGPGISRDNVGRVFEPFFTTKDPGEGVGLGLSISYNIIKEHGGNIEVDSREGMGTTFVIDIPHVAVRKESATPLSSSPSEMPQPGARILVVDDEEGCRRVYAESLASLGYNCSSAASYDDAVSLIGRTPDFDLIVSDFKMPGKNGGDLYDYLRNHHPRLAKNFIVVTGDTVSDSYKRFIKTHRVRVLEKPFPLSSLHDLVRTALPA